MGLLTEEKAQTSLEYLYLTGFVIGLAAITALLIQDILGIQEQAGAKVEDYRRRVIQKLVQ